jgi:hypothetical protein
MIQNSTSFQWAQKLKLCVSKLGKLPEEYLGPQKKQKAAVYFI